MVSTSAKQQIVEKIKDSNNVLVAVSTNPSVDELSAALALTLLINKLNKHATAVFSGNIPPAIGFLEPEKTFENTVDSLRDFIIALDKEKADHLRYKVVDDMVKIFITPYRTTISQEDLDFSQGDYNVETVVAIGVKKEEDLDNALTSHGRILHDAVVAAISLDSPSNLGGIEWTDTKASSYCEMLVGLADSLKTDKNVIDEQIATAFLTGIVAATDRFSNTRTTADSMTVAAKLMAAGANQQLIATKLQEDNTISSPSSTTSARPEGELVEGESTKIGSTQSTTENSSQTASKDDGVGSLSISHEPIGSVDEVAAQVAAQNSESAAARAQEELAKQTEVAEQKLAEQLPVVNMAPSDISNIHADLATGPEPDALRDPIAADQWRSKSDEEAGEPSFGGTLNATTEQAEEVKRQQLADDRNRTILSHGGPYASGEPTYQTPLNAVMADSSAEPHVRDVFADGAESDVTAHVDAIQPPAPVAPAPTLAEIDAKNRATHAEAMSAVNQALGDDTPATTLPPIASQSASPSLPPLPPMPDFSTLPPLPGLENSSQSHASMPDTLESLLPPADVTASPVIGSNTSSDPAAFKIPGQ
ncbi:hypothetical protein EOL96_04230 [Candidatus Saccharibacteria bacterium]|nr:hypothetical protein [Candidatus Saccharibacteria bacterium]